MNKLTNRHARKLQHGRKKRGGEVRRRFKSRTFSRSLGKELVLSSEGIGDKRSIGEETQTGRGEGGDSKPHSQISLAPLLRKEGHCIFREECLKQECPRNWITPKQLWKYASSRCVCVCVRRQQHSQSQIKGSKRNTGEREESKN